MKIDLNLSEEELLNQRIIDALKDKGPLRSYSIGGYIRACHKSYPQNLSSRLLSLFKAGVITRYRSQVWHQFTYSLPEGY